MEIYTKSNTIIVWDRPLSAPASASMIWYIRWTWITENIILFLNFHRRNLKKCFNFHFQDQIPTDNVRKSLLAMSKHGCFDEQRRQCLLQVVQLLNNLESMSQDDNEFSLEDEHFSTVNVSIWKNHFGFNFDAKHIFGNNISSQTSAKPKCSLPSRTKSIGCIPRSTWNYRRCHLPSGIMIVWWPVFSHTQVTSAMRCHPATNWLPRSSHRVIHFRVAWTRVVYSMVI